MNPERKPPTPATLEEVQQAPQGSIIRASDSEVLAIRIDSSTTPWGQPGELDDGVVAWATDEDAHAEMILRHGAVLVLPADRVPAEAAQGDTRDPFAEWLEADDEEMGALIDRMHVADVRKLASHIYEEQHAANRRSRDESTRESTLRTLRSRIIAATRIG